MQRPSGTVAFLFTDVEGSTRLWEERPVEMDAALAAHDRIMRAAVSDEDGLVFSTAGDAFAAAFHTAAQAVRAALAAQQALAPAASAGLVLAVRMAVHVGAASERDGDYFGPALNRAARLMALARGGQVLVSHAVERLTRGELPAGVSLVDLGERRLRGLSEPERVFQVAAPGLLSEPPEPTIGGNLPRPATTFVGRSADVEALQAELGRRRLVTLVGPGGMGKTRLAIETAHTMAGQLIDGVRFCELAPVDASGVAPAVAAAVGAVLRPGQDDIAQIVVALGERCLLLVLDNCEQVLEQAAEVARRILAAAPTVVLLCTSRAPLEVAGEQLWPVDGLADAAVELFRQRAAEQLPGFAPDAEESAAIAEICTRLDGMPLAVELAAARVRSLSPLDIAARLDERFRLLRSSGRGAPERQQTLRGAVQWSYDLLEDAERALFDRLSVFAGSFGLAAVEAVCADDPANAEATLDRDDVIDLLDALVTRSMVVRRPSSLGTRYVMLETLRSFAAERLEAAGAALHWRASHARWYRDLAVAEEQRLSTAEEAAAWRTLEAEWENLRSAFAYALAARDTDVAGDIPAALGFFALTALRSEVGGWARSAIAGGLLVGHRAELDVRGAWAMADYWLGGDFEATGEALGPDPGADAFTGRFTYALAAFMHAQASGDWRRADELTRAALAEAEGRAPGPGLVFAAGNRALYGAWSGDEAVDRLALASRAAEAGRSTGSPTLEAWGAWFRGLALIGGDPMSAVAAFDQARGHAAPLGEGHFVNLGCRMWLSVAAALGDDVSRAVSSTREVLELSAAYRTGNVTIQALRTAALTLARAGRASAAARLLGAADATGHTGGGHRAVIRQAETLLREQLGARADEETQAGRTLGVAAARALALDALAQAESPHPAGGA
ncbi:MAG: ATP-binding protein [Acidimicrobiales bacterium]